jgi:hypothetical protein
MKAKPSRKMRRRPSRESKRLRKSLPPLNELNRRLAAELSGGVDDEQALVVEESLDERERRG